MFGTNVTCCSEILCLLSNEKLRIKEARLSGTQSVAANGTCVLGRYMILSVHGVSSCFGSVWSEVECPVAVERILKAKPRE